MLGVRYGESQRRNKDLGRSTVQRPDGQLGFGLEVEAAKDNASQNGKVVKGKKAKPTGPKILACNQSGECGPDYLYFRLDKKIPKVLPILD